MRTDTFFENFGHLADAPNGVEKLRGLILQMAFKGQLTLQIVGAESAELIVARAKRVKKQLYNDGFINNPKKTEPLTVEEAPFGIPKTWVWVRLGEVIEYNAGSRVKPEEIENDAWILELEDIEKNTSVILKRLFFGERNPKSTKSSFKAHDVLYGKLRPYLNKIVVADANGYCTTEIVPLRPYAELEPKYILYALKRPDFLQYVNSLTYGINLPRLGTNDGVKAPFPLAPLEEQKRIVAKIDELMERCDRLERAREQRNRVHAGLTQASLNALTTAENPQAFNKSWRRVRENFAQLFTTVEGVQELRQTILQLAVQGKLVPQDPNDEPAEVLLELIKEAKKHALETKYIAKDKSFSPVMRKTPEWKLPSGWLWIRVQDIYEVTRGGSPRPAGDPQYFGGDVPWITVREITKDSKMYLTDTSDGLTELGSTKSSFVELGDMLLTNSGATLGVPKISKIRGCINDGVARLKRFHPYLSNQYAYIYLSQQTSAFRAVNQGMGQPNLNTPILAGWYFPLPPLNEQKRIVAKVDSLMALCDGLETKVVRKQADAERLAATVVHHLQAA